MEITAFRVKKIIVLFFIQLIKIMLGCIRKVLFRNFYLSYNPFEYPTCAIIMINVSTEMCSFLKAFTECKSHSSLPLIFAFRKQDHLIKV